MNETSYIPSSYRKERDWYYKQQWEYVSTEYYNVQIEEHSDHDTNQTSLLQNALDVTARKVK
jgi:hypothetical protein